MSQTRPNKAVVPINSDAYNLTADLATMGDSLNVVIKVASQAERDALTLANGLVVSRGDKAGRIEVCDGTNWAPHSGVIARIDRFSDVGFNTGESVIQTVAAILIAGHRYRVTAYGRCYGASAGAIIDYVIRTGTSGVGGTQVGAGIQVLSTTTPEGFCVVADFDNTTTNTGSTVTFTAKSTGSATATIAAAAGRPLTLTVEDLGAY